MWVTGRVFEDVVKRYIIENYTPMAIGRWVGSCDGEETDIDVVANVHNEDGLEVTMVCECKFTKEKADFTELNKLVKRVDVSGCGNNRRLMIVSGSRFTERHIEYATENDIILIGTDKILGATEPDAVWPKARNDGW